jgi:hypothetical protein
VLSSCEEISDAAKSVVPRRLLRLVSGPRSLVCNRSTHSEIAIGGPAAEAETRRMVSEKIDAGLTLQALALTGGLGLTTSSTATKTLAHYRRKVRANRRRLERG